MGGKLLSLYINSYTLKMKFFPNVRDKIDYVFVLNIDTCQNSNLSNSPTSATTRYIYIYKAANSCDVKKLLVTCI